MARKPSTALRASLLANVQDDRWEHDEDIKSSENHGPHDGTTSKRALLGLAFQTLGVIYGDIATSPLYVLAGVFHRPPKHQEDVLGVASLILWTIFALVVVKYALIVLRADDNGNGGAFALFSLVRRATHMRFEAEGPGLPSDYEVTHFYTGSTNGGGPGPGGGGTTPAGSAATAAAVGAAAEEGEPVLQHPLRANSGSRSRWQQGVGGAGGSFGGSFGGRGGGGGGVGGRAPAGGKSDDWRTRLGRSFFLRKSTQVMVVIGVGFILGDGVMTPAISVLSAVEGVKGVLPGVSQTHVVAATVAILLGIFGIQRYGTHRVSGIFAPVILLWLLLNAAIGIHNVATYGTGVLAAVSPTHMVALLRRSPLATWRKLSGVLLCVTGTEALFADLGHFSRPSVQLSCLGLVFPSLVCTYLGQAAYLMQNPHHVHAVFWKSLPPPLYLPMLGLATLATITASQALVSAVFSIVSQAIRQGFFPKFQVVHTSRQHGGQVYVPLVNTIMCCLTAAVVLIFQRSDKLGSAYGIAVICDMLVTTVFMCLVMLLAWRLHPVYPAAFLLVFGSIEAAFLSASASKVLHGGWFSLAMAAVWGFLMWTWNWGSVKKLKYAQSHMRKLRELVRHELRLDTAPAAGNTSQDTSGDLSRDASGDGSGYGGGEGARERLVEKLQLEATGEPVVRYAGVGFWYCEGVGGVPPGLADFLHKVPALPRVVMLVTNRRLSVPEVPPEERLLIQPLSLSGFYHCVARYGYMEPIQQGNHFSQLVASTLIQLLMRSRAAQCGDLGPGARGSQLGSGRQRSGADGGERPEEVSIPIRGSSGGSSLPLAPAPLVQGMMSTSAPSTTLTGDGGDGIDAVNFSNTDAADVPYLEAGHSGGTNTAASASFAASAAAGDGSGGDVSTQGQGGCHLQQQQQSSAQQRQQQGGSQQQQQQRGRSKGRSRIWRSFSDSNLLEDDPFMAQVQELPFIGRPPLLLGGARGNGEMGVDEEQRALWLQVLDREINLVKDNMAEGARRTYVFGRNHIKARPGSNPLRWLMLEGPYQVLVNNFTVKAFESYGVPSRDVIEVSQVYHL